jgi:hypothetical protein
LYPGQSLENLSLGYSNVCLRDFLVSDSELQDAMAVADSSTSFVDYFSALNDPRQAWKVLFPLDEVLLLSLCAVLSGADDLAAVAMLEAERESNGKATRSRRFLYHLRQPRYQTFRRRRGPTGVPRTDGIGSWTSSSTTI